MMKRREAQVVSTYGLKTTMKHDLGLGAYNKTGVPVHTPVK